MADEDIKATTSHTETALPAQYLHGMMEPESGNNTPSSPLLLQRRNHRQPRRSDQDYNQFKARVTEVVNQQHSVSPSSFTSRGRRYAQLRRKKLASIAPFSKKQESKSKSHSGKSNLVVVNDADQPFLPNDDYEKKERPYTIRETSESSSASQHEWRSALKDQVMSNVLKSQQVDTSGSVHSNYEELMPDSFRNHDIFRAAGVEDNDWANEHCASPEQSHFEQLDAKSDFRVSPFRPRYSRSLSPSRSGRRRSTSRRSRTDKEDPTSPKSTMSLRTPRSAIISPRRRRLGSIKSPKSVNSNKSATSKSFFSGTTISESQGSAASNRSRGSSRSPRGNRSRSTSPFKIPTLASPTARRTYKELSSPESDAATPALKPQERDDIDFLTVPRLDEPIVESSIAESPETGFRGSPLIFRDFFTGESEMLVSAPNSPESKRSVVTTNEGSTIQSLSPVHVQSQREENFFEEVQRPSPDLQLFLPRTCTLSITDGEDNDDDIDVLSKVTISTTSGIRIKREDDGSPVGRQIVEHVMAQLEKEQEEAQLSDDEGGTSPKSHPRSKEKRRKRKIEKNERDNTAESLPEQSPAAPEELDAYSDPDLNPPGLHSPPPIRRIRMEEEDETGSVEQDEDDYDDDTDDSEAEFDYPADDSIPTTNTAYPPTTDGIDPTYHETVLPTPDAVHRDPDSFEMHPLVALSTSDSSSVPYQTRAQYYQTQPLSAYERYRPPSTDPSESLKSFTDSQSRSTIMGARTRRREEKARVNKDRTLHRPTRNGGDGDESYESFDDYDDTGRGFFHTLCDPISEALYIPPPTRQSRTELHDHETIDSGSYIRTTYGRPLPIQSATNLSIEEDDMFDVIESCCG